MRLDFHGAAGTVTGSKTLVTTGNSKVLIDCGLFQGFQELRQRNWRRPPVDPKELDAVVLTHAHLDHSGWVPRLVKEGFAGPIYCTPATHELCHLLLLDSGHLQEEDAAYANRKGYSKHEPALPLYTEEEALKSLRYLVDVEWDQPVRLTEDLGLTLLPAGHILGASIARLDNGRSTLAFSGDLGRPKDPIMNAPRTLDRVDWLVLESTYGGRLHPGEDPFEQLATVVNRTMERGGTLLVPAFAIGRTQTLLWALQVLKERRAIPDVPVWLDSPMATNATELYLKYSAQHRLTAEQAARMWSGVHLSRKVEDSMAIDQDRNSKIVVSAAGMLTGGRVLHHLKAFAGDPRNTLLFSGFQAGGTRGAAVLAGAEAVRVHGMQVPIACEVARIEGLSAHADQQELMDWLGAMSAPPLRVFLNHGEPEGVEALRHRIEQELGWPCTAVTDGMVARLQEPEAQRAVARSSLPLLDDPALARRQEALQQSPTYLLAEEDAAFLGGDAERGTRLMLEYDKVEQGLLREGVGFTVAVFGSSRTAPGEHWYEEARTFARLAASQPLASGEALTIMTGGGPGIMEAANRGAFESGHPSVGLNIDLVQAQQPNPWVTPELCFRVRSFSVRKLHLLRRAMALVAFPGGYGTLDEVFGALALVQRNKRPPLPIVLVGRDHWSRVLNLGWLFEQGMISADDLSLVQQTDTAEGAWSIVRSFYETRPKPTPWGE